MQGKIAAIMLVKNEEDIIGFTISHLLSQGVDIVLVDDNLSTDATRAVLLKLMVRYGDERVIVRSDTSPAFYQARKLNAMARRAEELGAEWIFACDADELFYSMDPEKTIADQIKAVSDSDVIGVPMWNHYCTSRDNNSDPNPFRRMPWRYTDRNPLDKCIIRANSGLFIDEGNHRALRLEVPVSGIAASIGIRHLSARGCEQWIGKSLSNARALECARSLSPDIGAHCRNYKKIYDEKGPNALAHVFYTFFYFDIPHDKMTLDPAPYGGDL